MSQRLLVTGIHGQIAMALAERAVLNGSFEIVALGRPQLDLADPSTVGAAIEMASPDIIVSAAAHTAVDQAESEEELATRIKADTAPGVWLALLDEDFDNNSKKLSWPDACYPLYK